MITKREMLKLQFERWVYVIEHYGWKLVIRYRDSADDMPDVYSPDCAAGTTASFKYLEATIDINLKQCESLDEQQIEYVVIHELVHLLISPLQESSETTPLEYTVTSIARIMQGLRNQ